MGNEGSVPGNDTLPVSVTVTVGKKGVPGRVLPASSEEAFICYRDALFVSLSPLVHFSHPSLLS